MSDAENSILLDKDVEAVLLPTGWEWINKGSFGQNAATFWFEQQTRRKTYEYTAKVYGPLSSLLAVKSL